jgi:hypothetical protein
MPQKHDLGFQKKAKSKDERVHASDRRDNKKEQRRLRIARRIARAEATFQELESRRRDWPEGKNEGQQTGDNTQRS